MTNDEMSKELWTAVDRYFADLLVGEEASLAHAQDASQEAGLPAIQVSAAQGKLLQILARATGARSILEIGTLGGYSTIWLARALPAGGRLVTLELDPGHAALARKNLEYAGLDGRVEIRVGPALESLQQLTAEKAGAFDFAFIDADKENIAEYFLRTLAMCHAGSVIVVDNVVRDGAVIDPDSIDPRVQGVRRFNEVAANDPRVSVTAIQTVGAKGYDGFAVALVVAR